MLHKNIVCDTSDFFRVTCKGSWREAADKIVRLREVEEEAFRVYLGWLFTSKIDIRQDLASNTYTKDIASDDLDKLYDILIEVYVLGDMLQDASFRNAITDKVLNVIKCTGEDPRQSHVQLLYSKIPLPTKMSRLFADAYFVTQYNGSTFAEMVPLLPPAFVAEFACACVEDRDMTKLARIPCRRPKRFYYDHKDGSKKCT